MQSKRLAWVLAPTLFFGAAISPTFGDTAHFTVTFTASTRDLHLTAGSNGIKGVKVTGPSGTETPPNSSNGTDPPSGAYNAAWTTAPGAGTYTIDLNGHMGSDTGWGGKIALTTDGSLKRPVDASYTGTFASIFPIFDPNFAFASLYAVDTSADMPLDLTDFQASVISDPNSIDSPNWIDATGSIYSFSDAVLSPGDTPTLLGTVPFDDSGWLKITATIDGSEQAMGYTPTAVPEPYTSLLMGAGLVVLGMLRRKQP
jgi:hypothetical protein